MTAIRTRGSQINRNSNTDLEQLEGVTALVEDWHAKQCLLGVSFRWRERACIHKVL